MIPIYWNALSGNAPIQGWDQQIISTIWLLEKFHNLSYFRSSSCIDRVNILNEGQTSSTSAIVEQK